MTEQQFTMRELATMLAALRNWQTALPKGIGAYEDIATNGGCFEALFVGEIDDLCIKLNGVSDACRSQRKKSDRPNN
jgi:hypothetical protein